MNGQDRKWMNKFQSDIFFQLGQIQTWMSKHDENATERTACITKKFDDIFDHLDRVQKSISERKWIHKATVGLYAWIGTLTLILIGWVVTGAGK